LLTAPLPQTHAYLILIVHWLDCICLDVDVTIEARQMAIHTDVVAWLEVSTLT
jgi:hypothetical protein